MSVFGELYSQYYDLLYKGKDYETESNYIIDLIKKNAPAAKSIIELGCGTGLHASFFAKAGYYVYGIDRSSEMLIKARKHQQVYPGLLEFAEGDIETFKVNKSFDVALSLFHVIGYLNDNKQLINTFKNIHTHLQPGGIFIFDCWYGPGVLRDLPQVRMKRLENEKIEISRIAEPEIHSTKNTVDVNYTLFIKDKSSAAINEVKESHRMRYFFEPEIELLLSQAGLTVIQTYKYLTTQRPDLNTWNAVFICKK